MAASTSANNKWIHQQLQRIMGPALAILIGSSIFRGFLGLIIAVSTNNTGSYDDWPFLAKLAIELIVFFGVFLTSDVCYFATVTNCETEKKHIRAMADTEPPRFKGSEEQIRTQSLNWQKQHDGLMALAKQELGIERQARLAFGFVSLSYGLNFIVQSTGLISPAVNKWLLLGIDAESLAVGMFVIWYYAARYKQEKPDPEEKSEGLIVKAVDARLDLVADHFEKGEPTDQDLNLADAGLSARHHYKHFVAALRVMPDKNDLLTTNDIFDALHLEDLGDATEIQTAQRKIRRIISEAFSKHAKGVYKDVKGGRTTWHVDGDAFYRLFGDFMKNGQITDKRRTGGARQRPSRFAATGQAPDGSRITTVQGTLPESPQDNATPPAEPPAAIAGLTYEPPVTAGLVPMA